MCNKCDDFEDFIRWCAGANNYHVPDSYERWQQMAPESKKALRQRFHQEDLAVIRAAQAGERNAGSEIPHCR